MPPLKTPLKLKDVLQQPLKAVSCLYETLEA